MNITHDMNNDLTEYDPESRQVDGPNPIENRISSSAARVPDIISCTSGITVQGRQLHSFAFTTDAAIIRNTNADAILAVYPFTGEPVITQALLTWPRPRCSSAWAVAPPPARASSNSP